MYLVLNFLFRNSVLCAEAMCLCAYNNVSDFLNRALDESQVSTGDR